ncbi:hypothetical protein SCHPADRAFT_892833 [Schizopora paradoxa]|uniref:DUF6533 domain-containing protein n=1 Tax=Schizopora paradoxa TaxID=27342 RepID=A0A0H2RJY0_9AGAM|nr:hypothetical protein SCHPADRAFT_892833 [Schizopora paradoxa]
MDQIPPASLAPIYHEFAVQGTGIKCGMIASYTILVYDAIISFSDEVEYIWKRKFTLVTYAYFVSITPSRHVADGNVFPFEQKIYFLALPNRCKRLVFFQPLAIGIPLTFVPNVVIGLRLYALYKRNKKLAAFLIIYLVGELGVALWLYLTPSLYNVVLPGPKDITDSLVLHVCLAGTSPRLSNAQAATFQIMQTLFDTICLGLTIWMTLKEYMEIRTVQHLGRTLLKHGIIYYLVVFTLNLSWAIMIGFATTGLKYSLSAPTLALAPVAANRLILSLRSFNEQARPAFDGKNDRTRGMKRRNSWLGTSTLEVHEDEDVKGSVDSGDYELGTLQSGSDRRSSITLVSRTVHVVA